MYEIDLYKLSVPKVCEAVLSDNSITLIYGWRDGGKSTSTFNTLIWQCLLSPSFRWAHCRSKYNEIAGSTFQTLKDQIKALGLENYFIISKDRFQIINKINKDNYFFGASADQPDKIRSTPNLNGILLEEAHDCSESDFASLLGTMRNKAGQIVKPKFIAIFNNDKVSQKGFIYKSFFDPKSVMYNKVERVLISYLDNPYVDKIATKEKLINVCLGDINKYKRLLSGEFIQEENDSPFFEYFNKNIHTKRVVYDAKYPILVSLDFNTNPNTATLWQYNIVNTNLAHPLSFVHCIDMLQKKGSIELLLHEIRKKYPTARFYLTGDASGSKHDSGYSGDDTLWIKAERELRIPHSLNFARNKNASHAYSFNACNTVLNICKNFAVNIELEQVINEMETARLVISDKGKKELYKNRADGFEMDITDTIRYALDYIATISKIDLGFAYK